MSKYYVTLKYQLNVAGIDHSAELWIDVADSASNQVGGVMDISLPWLDDLVAGYTAQGGIICERLKKRLDDLVVGYTARVPSKTNTDHDPEHKEVMRQVLEMFPNASDITIIKEERI